MPSGGYVRLYRSLLGHAAFRNDAEAMAFAWMIARAAWRPTKVRYRERTISLVRGQLAVSIRDLAEHLDRPKGWTERLLKRLKSETMIETASETGVLVITICKYKDYQGENDKRETVNGTTRRTGAGQGQDTEQRREENKNKFIGDFSGFSGGGKRRPKEPPAAPVAKAIGSKLRSNDCRHPARREPARMPTAEDYAALGIKIDKPPTEETKID